MSYIAQLARSKQEMDPFGAAMIGAGQVAGGLFQFTQQQQDRQMEIQEKLRRIAAETKREERTDLVFNQQQAERRAKEVQGRAHDAFSRGRYEEAYNLGKEYLGSYNQAYDTNLVGPKLPMTQPYANNPDAENPQVPSRTDFDNPMSPKAIAQMIQYKAPAGQVIEASAPLVQLIPGPDGKMVANPLYTPPAKPVKPDYSNYQISWDRGMVLDLASGKLIKFAEPSASMEMKQQQLDFTLQKLQLTLDNGNANRMQNWQQGLVEHVSRARNAALQAGEDPVSANQIAEQAAAEYRQMVPQPPQVNPFTPGTPGTPGTAPAPQGGNQMAQVESIVKLIPGATVTSGKRSYAEQERLYKLYLSGKGNLAAPPGTSDHETDNARDVHVPLAYRARFIDEMKRLGYRIKADYADGHIHVGAPHGATAAPATKPGTATPQAGGNRQRVLDKY